MVEVVVAMCVCVYACTFLSSFDVYLWLMLQLAAGIVLEALMKACVCVSIKATIMNNSKSKST